MNWDAIGAIAETLGAVGVIGSLVYLAGQIRQNTRTVRSATYQSLIGVSMQSQGNLAYDGETAEIVRKGMQDESKLSEAEAFRFNWFVGGLFNMAENSWYQFRNGMLSPDRWKREHNTLRFHLSSPGVRAWWTTFDKSTLDAGFARLVDDMMQQLEEEQP